MIVVLSSEDLIKPNLVPSLNNTDKYFKIKAEVKGIYSGEHKAMELCEEDVVIFKNGSETIIIKGPGEKIK